MSPWPLSVAKQSHISLATTRSCSYTLVIIHQEKPSSCPNWQWRRWWSRWNSHWWDLCGGFQVPSELLLCQIMNTEAVWCLCPNFNFISSRFFLLLSFFRRKSHIYCTLVIISSLFGRKTDAYLHKSIVGLSVLLCCLCSRLHPFFCALNWL